MQHIYASKYRGAKGHSPYISVSGEGDVILGYGNGKGLTLREAISLGDADVAGVKIQENEEIMKAISKGRIPPADKNRLLYWAAKDNELLLEGIIPKRFLKII